MPCAASRSHPARTSTRARTELGFTFAKINGEIYWDERAYYAFSLDQIERDLEDPTQDLHELCLALVDRVVKDDALLRRLAFPRTRGRWCGQVGTGAIRRSMAASISPMTARGRQAARIQRRYADGAV